MAPRAQPCELCGQMFFPASLKFHMKRCQEKQQFIMTECAYCQAEMPQGQLEHHVAKCKAALAVAANAAGTAVNGSPDSGVPPPPPVATRMPDGRMRCHFCGRGFATNRVHEHAVICGKLKQARPRAPDGEATQQLPPQQPQRQQQPQQQEREHSPQNKQRQLQFRKDSLRRVAAADQAQPADPDAEAAAEEPTTEEEEDTAQDWRAKRQDFLAAVRAARQKARQGQQEDHMFVEADAEPQDCLTKEASLTRKACPTKAVPRLEHLAKETSKAETAKAFPAAAPRAQQQQAATCGSPTTKALRSPLATRRSSGQSPKRVQSTREIGGRAAESATGSPLASPLASPITSAVEAAAAAAVAEAAAVAAAAALRPSVGAPVQAAADALGDHEREVEALMTPTLPEAPVSRRLSTAGLVAPGSRVEVCGLAHAPQFNGQLAVLLDFDEDADCWLARLDGGVVKALRKENLAPLGSQAAKPAAPVRASPPTPTRQTSLVSMGGTPAKPATAGATLGSRRSKGGEKDKEKDQAPLATPKTRIPRAPRSQSVEARPVRELSPKAVPRSTTGGSKPGTGCGEELTPVLSGEVFTEPQGMEPNDEGTWQPDNETAPFQSKLISPSMTPPGRSLANSRSLKAPSKPGGSIVLASREESMVRSMSLPPSRIPQPKSVQSVQGSGSSRTSDVANSVGRSLRSIEVVNSDSNFSINKGIDDDPRIAIPFNPMEALADIAETSSPQPRMISACSSKVQLVPQLVQLPLPTSGNGHDSSGIDPPLSSGRTAVDQHIGTVLASAQLVNSLGGRSTTPLSARGQQSAKAVHPPVPTTAWPVWNPQPMQTYQGLSTPSTTTVGHPVPSYPSTPSTTTSTPVLTAVMPHGAVVTTGKGHAVTSAWATAVASLDVRLGPGVSQQGSRPGTGVAGTPQAQPTPVSSVKLPAPSASPSPPSRTPLMHSRNTVSAANLPTYMTSMASALAPLATNSSVTRFSSRTEAV